MRPGLGDEAEAPEGSRLKEITVTALRSVTEFFRRAGVVSTWLFLCPSTTTARFCILIQGADKPDQALIHSSTGVLIRP